MSVSPVAFSIAVEPLRSLCQSHWHYSNCWLCDLGVSQTGPVYLLRPCGCDVHKSANCMICPCASWAPPLFGSMCGKSHWLFQHRTTMTQTRAWSAWSSGDWPPTTELVRFCVPSLERLTRTMTSDLLVRLGSCVLSVFRGTT